MHRMTSARLNGTPAASKLESSRVKVSSGARRNLLASKFEIQTRGRARRGGGIGSRAFLGRAFGGGFFREADRLESLFLHLPEGFLPPARLNLALGDSAGGLKRFVLEKWHEVLYQGYAAIVFRALASDSETTSMSGFSTTRVFFAPP